jgi:hypothetical protein
LNILIQPYGTKSDRSSPVKTHHKNYILLAVLLLATLGVTAMAAYLLGVRHGASLEVEKSGSAASTVSSSATSDSTVSSHDNAGSPSSSNAANSKKCILELGVKLAIDNGWTCVANSNLSNYQTQGYVEGDGITIVVHAPIGQRTKAGNGITVEPYYARGNVSVFQVSTPAMGDPSTLEGFIASKDIGIYVIYTNSKTAPNAQQEQQIKAVLDSIELI